jgi:hypothetical protein
MQKKKPERKHHPIKKLYTATIGKIGTLNLVLILVGVFFIWFNAQMLSIFRAYGSIPETYACAVVTATIGECGICGWIKTNKDRKREHDWEKQDNKAIDEMEDDQV